VATSIRCVEVNKIGRFVFAHALRAVDDN